MAALMRKPAHHDLSAFGRLLQPAEAMEPILARPVRNALLEWLVEIWADDELAAVGVAPRRKALFTGPPGVGKTTLAHHLAARLGMPMLCVRPESLIGRWLGSTAQNLGRLFDAAAAADPPIVLFFDEFEAIAQKRMAATQGAEDERNSWVNVLLQRVELHQGLVIAATNFGERLDEAIWRRFDIHIKLDLPGQFERERITARYLDPFGLPAKALSVLAVSLEGAAPALIRAFCEGLKRQIVLGPKLQLDSRRDAVIGRVLATVQPHPDLGKPRLWSLLSEDPAVGLLPWPLPRKDEVVSDTDAAVADDVVVTMPKRSGIR